MFDRYFFLKANIAIFDLPKSLKRQEEEPQRWEKVKNRKLVKTHSIKAEKSLLKT